MKKVFCILMVFMMLPAISFAQDNSSLAKEAQNPVADLISLPFQNNTNFGVGPDDETQNILNIQPVWPFNMNENWKITTRTIAPVIYQPEIIPGAGSEFGLGDVNITAFISPSESGEWIWGAGPIFAFPTATDDVLGTGKWSIGPSAVLLTMRGKWVFGGLVNNIWSYAGDDDRGSINSFLFQYFINYNMEDGWYLTSAPIITANWEADSNNQWTVPFGLGCGKVSRWGKQPVNISAHAYYNVEKPENAADWTLRLQMQFLFPK